MPQFDTSFYQSSISWLLIVLLSIFLLYKYYVIPNFVKTLKQRVEFIGMFEEKERAIQIERREIFRKHQELLAKTKKDCEEAYYQNERALVAKSKKKLNDYHQKLIEKYQFEKNMLNNQFVFLDKSIRARGQEIAQEIVESLNQLSEHENQI